MVYTRVAVLFAMLTLVMCTCVYGTPLTLARKICSKTETPDICVRGLWSDTRSEKATDTLTLARIGIQVLASKNNETRTGAFELTNDPTVKPIVWSHRAPCFRAYDDSKASIEVDALRLFDSKNFTGAAQSVAVVKKAGEECMYYKVPQLKEANTFLIAFATDLITILTSLHTA